MIKKLITYRTALYRFWAIVLLLVLILLQVNQGVNGHCHHLRDGTTIFHAHPYGSGHSSGDAHSAQEYFLFQVLADLFYLVLIAAILTLIKSIRRVDFNRIFTDTFFPVYRLVYLNKAPPTFF